MRAGFHFDHPREDRAARVIERVFVKQIAGGTGRDVILERPLIKLLLAFRDRDRKHVAAAAFADQAACALGAGIAAAEIDIEALGRGIAPHDGVVDLECQRFAAPILDADIVQLRPGPHIQIVEADGQCGGIRLRPHEVIHQRHLAILLGDEERVRERRIPLAREPMENLDGQVDLHAARDVQERPRLHRSRVQRREFRAP